MSFRTVQFHRRAMNASQSVAPWLWQGLVGAWMPALGVQGDVVFDASGAVSNGAMMNYIWPSQAPPRWASGPLGSAIDLTVEDSNLVQVASSDRLNFGASDSFTAIVSGTMQDRATVGWRGMIRKCTANMYLSSGTGWGIETTGSGSTSGYWSVRAVVIAGGVLKVSSSSSTVQGIGLGRRHTYAMTVNRATQRLLLHVDGIPQGASGTDISAVGSLSNASPLWIGYDLRNHDGTIDAVLVYRRVLSQAEIVALSADPLLPFRRQEGGLGRVVSIARVPVHLLMGRRAA